MDLLFESFNYILDDTNRHTTTRRLRDTRDENLGNYFYLLAPAHDSMPHAS